MASTTEQVILEMQAQGGRQAAAQVDQVTDSVEGTGEAAQEAESQFSRAFAGIAAGAAATALAVAAIGQQLDLQDVSGKLQAQLGLDDSSAGLLAKDVGKVYAQNFGESFDDVGDAMRASIQAGFADVDDGSQIAASKAILGIKAAFGAESDEIARTVGALLNNGLAKSSDEAFDIITRGFQKGADKGGEFLDTLNEYSEPFKSLGFSARDATNALVAGSKNGVYSVDKIGDAVKEFGIRAVDGSDATKKAFQEAGLDATVMAQKIAEGGPTARQAFGQVIKGLGGIGSKVKREQAGVALFGSLWEDIGSKAILGLDPAINHLGKTKGATDEVNDALGKSFRARWEAIERASMAAFSNALIKAIYAVANGVAWVIREFKAGNPVVIIMASVLGTIVTVLAAQAIAMGIAAVATLGWAAATKAATIASNLLKASLLANPFVRIAMLVVAVGVAIWQLYKRNETFRNAVNKAWAAIKGAVGGAFEWIKPKLEAFASAMQTLWAKAKSVAAGIRDRFNTVVSFFRALPGRIGGFFSGMWEGVKEVFRGGINTIIRFLNGFVDRYNGTLGGLASQVGIDVKIDRIPELYTGGKIIRGGAALVGERGPELVKLPGGSTVYDAQQSAMAMQGAQGMKARLVLGDPVGGNAEWRLLAKLLVKAIDIEAAHA